MLYYRLENSLRKRYIKEYLISEIKYKYKNKVNIIFKYKGNTTYKD